ncbi:sugar transferase [Caminibacter pacificus]|uniref:Sugar transferase n=1 Tax=Caminibacter pacificus TaxID=1424653 RepID=A0AAJ4RBS2_9BACT|nr:sugar transferase [Caminibacter pacificus]NPA87533.1 sugar transferase [Campylobacterota bacterium]QCI29019.1 sugar transferase [Caminibacter pacificus]ROR39170.1 undecaprenyl phosphate N,N'-diacetylbacillosamine 1-phosphate transferase [Caminibacter pacificus]
MYKNFFKPLFDRVLALILIILFLPVMAVVAILIYLWDGRPVIFTQERPGYKGKIFKIYKFRTMTNEKDENGNLLPDEERLKGVGKVIRSLSLDELPQLFNVLKGDMSFVGPRPLLVEYLELYDEEQKRRHDVKPGITGLAQVMGRNAISWREKFKYDVYYVDNVSFLLDMKILFLTVLKVLKREGISQEGRATMEKFNGKN